MIETDRHDIYFKEFTHRRCDKSCIYNEVFYTISKLLQCNRSKINGEHTKCCQANIFLKKKITSCHKQHSMTFSVRKILKKNDDVNALFSKLLIKKKKIKTERPSLQLDCKSISELNILFIFQELISIHT
jgi:hypothetical protein